MRHVPAIDASGLHILEELVEDANENGYILVFSAVKQNVYQAMQNSGLVEAIGSEHFAADIFAALEMAKNHLDASK